MYIKHSTVLIKPVVVDPLLQSNWCQCVTLEQLSQCSWTVSWLCTRRVCITRPPHRDHSAMYHAIRWSRVKLVQYFRRYTNVVAHNSKWRFGAVPGELDVVLRWIQSVRRMASRFKVFLPPRRQFGRGLLVWSLVCSTAKVNWVTFKQS